FAAAMTQAELQMHAAQHRDAIATLLKAKQDAPSQPRLLKLLAESYERLGDWEALIALAPELQGRGVYSADAMRAAVQRWWLAYLDQPVANPAHLAERWNAADKDVRGTAPLVAAYARAATRAGATGEAETALSKAIG